MVLLLIAFYGFAGGFLIVTGCAALRWFLKLAFALSPERLRLVVPYGYLLLIGVPVVAMVYVDQHLLDTATSAYRRDVNLAFGLPVALGIAPWLVIWWILSRTVWKVRG